MQSKEKLTMNKDRVKGAARQVSGKVKKTAGELTGDVSLQAKGTAQQAAGKVQSLAGKARDELHKKH
jgi:uncharacterized protein YjbJ (UPF0337 family)